MKKGSGTKTRISITIDEDLAEKLNKECEKRIMKISPYIESIIKKELEK
jgi:metal-responsive CopG/Arc/MetJ family transcriptional regulator